MKIKFFFKFKRIPFWFPFVLSYRDMEYVKDKKFQCDETFISLTLFSILIVWSRKEKIK